MCIASLASFQCVGYTRQMDERLVSGGRKGGIIRWSKIDKEKRSAMMKRLANRRWKNRAKQLKVTK